MQRRTFLFAAAGSLGLTAGAFGQAKKAEKTEKAKDPVCGLMVDKDPKLSVVYNGETYYFCSNADMNEFKKSPEKYAKKGSR